MTEPAGSAAASGADNSADPDVKAAVSQAFQREWGQLVATLCRVTGDLDLAEDCSQEAFSQALLSWTRTGIPNNPGGWLTTTARNRAIDRLRRDAAQAKTLKQLAAMEQTEQAAEVDQTEAHAVRDDRLRLMFTCCHPALPLEARVALTLRTLAGLTTAEIASAFMVSESAMARRLTRAKQKIRDSAIPYRIPPAHLLTERLSAVLGVLYLLFNEGYSASAGADLVRTDLCNEAIRLTRVLVEFMPDVAEASGLLALMLLHDSRRASRIDEAGAIVTLDKQDRSLWDHHEIRQGLALLDSALLQERPGKYQIQAAIAACHVAEGDTDWRQIAALYGELTRLTNSPVADLNRSVAIGMAEGPEIGLQLVDELALSGALEGYYLLPATRADLLRRLDRSAEAAEAYRQAWALARTHAERDYLSRRLQEMTELAAGQS